MAGVDSLESTLYYQYLINNNSASTMLNAISGTNSTDGIGGLGSFGSIGSVDGTESGSFYNILQRYLTGTDNTTDSLEMATMADKLSGVLEEAAKTEDTGSLTYQTVQELYEYFSGQVSTKASQLMGGTYGTQSASSGSSTANSGGVSGNIQEMNEAAAKGQEFDFSQIDEMVDSVFEETMPME